MPSLVEFGPVVLKKKIFKFHQCIVKVYNNANNDDNNYDGKLTDFEQKSSLKPLANKNLHMIVKIS